ncbi:Alpha/beta hydrolase family protein [compost metagenome]
MKPRDAIGIATELHTLLEKMGAEKPYILVGHSMGGQYIRVFQSLYPNEVAGLVTVDGTVDTMTTQIIPLFEPELIDMYQNQVFTDSNLGLYSDIEASGQQARDARYKLKNVPLTVLCAEYQIGPMSPPEDQELVPLFNSDIVDPLWKSLQEGLAAESKFGKFVYATNSAHEINLYRPELITQEVKLMFNKVK